ncbi:lachesin-like isoform X1 [Vespula squamosa]|uniref:Lachesin-like isoform X1 n=1 Tax=Vespula squamosa TaxID=30214 RepID=A0ABD1ZVB2_VESSQ
MYTRVEGVTSSSPLVRLLSSRSAILSFPTVRVEQNVKTDMGSTGAVSRLYIANANKKDSGNYSCALADIAAVTVVSVHVLNASTVLSYVPIVEQAAIAGNNFDGSGRLFELLAKGSTTFNQEFSRVERRHVRKSRHGSDLHYLRWITPRRLDTVSSETLIRSTVKASKG